MKALKAGLVCWVFLVLAGPLHAQTPSDERLLNAVDLFTNARISEAKANLESVPDTSLSPRDRAIRDLYLGVIAHFNQSLNEARDLYRRALDTDSGVRLDPSLHAPTRVQLFQEVRTEWLEAGSAIVSLRFLGAPESVLEGQSIRLVALALRRDGQAVESQNLWWTSENQEIASIDRDGLLIARQAGVVTVTASLEGLTASLRLSVLPELVSLTINGGGRILSQGDIVSLETTAQSREGLLIEGYQIVWRSQDQSVVTVDRFGALRAVGAGRTSITASSGDVSTSVPIEVVAERTEARIDRIRVGEVPARIFPGDTLRLVIEALGSDGQVLEGQSVTLQSSDPRVASVSQGGIVLARVPGTTDVVISVAEGPTERIPLTVTARPVSNQQSARGSWLGLLIPGGGQFATGRSGAGTLVLLAAGGSAAAGFLITKQSELCGAPLDNSGRCPQGSVLSTTVERPYQMIGIGAAAAISLLAGFSALGDPPMASAIAVASKTANSPRLFIPLHLTPSPDGGLTLSFTLPR